MPLYDDFQFNIICKALASLATLLRVLLSRPLCPLTTPFCPVQRFTRNIVGWSSKIMSSTSDEVWPSNPNYRPLAFVYELIDNMYEFVRYIPNFKPVQQAIRLVPTSFLLGRHSAQMDVSSLDLSESFH